MKRLFVGVFATVLLCSPLVGCGGGSDVEYPKGPPPPTQEITKKEAVKQTLPEKPEGIIE